MNMLILRSIVEKKRSQIQPNTVQRKALQLLISWEKGMRRSILHKTLHISYTLTSLFAWFKGILWAKHIQWNLFEMTTQNSSDKWFLRGVVKRRGPVYIQYIREHFGFDLVLSFPQGSLLERLSAEHEGPVPNGEITRISKRIRFMHHMKWKSRNVYVFPRVLL